ncbi:MAG: indolepyruvate ferredoxin oxidoreductase family protein, partial [Gammaproteobacteria bacterium]
SRHDGIFSLWYGKGPGVDRSGDALRHGNYAGVSRHGGVLLAVGDDPVCHSSTVPQQSESVLAASSIPVFHAANLQDVYDFGLLGWDLSRYSGLWIALKMVTDVAESSQIIRVDSARSRFQLPAIELPDPGQIPIRWPDKAMLMAERLANFRLPALQQAQRSNGFDFEAISSQKRRFGIVAAGKSYTDVRQALDDLGISEEIAADIGLNLYKVGMPWPLETEGLEKFARGMEQLLVVEEGRPFLEPQVKDALYAMSAADRPEIIGKRDSAGVELTPAFGELSAADIAALIAGLIKPFFSSDRISARLALIKQSQQAVVVHHSELERTPHFCSGCPHNTSTKVPEGSVALAGIGCHFMSQWMDRDTLTYTHMGAEGTTWAGLGHFSDLPHLFTNIGDGTYYHSGLLAIRQAVASGVNITYKILYNDAVAMTGGQPVDGPISVQQISYQLYGEKVSRIALVSDSPEKFDLKDFAPGVTLDHRDDLDRIQRELREVKGTSVIIYEQVCGTEKRRRRKRGLLEDPDKRTFINSRVCEGCGDCGEKSNCLSVQPLETEFGRKRRIDQSACTKDFSCVKGFCPSFVTIHGGELRKPETGDQLSDAALQPLFASLPTPEVATFDGSYSLLIGGIGGTGVVTTSSLLGVAARLDGKACRLLDDTGLAQKFGAVYSHLTVADSDAQLHSPRIGVASCDLLISADLVTGGSDRSLSRLKPGLSKAVANRHETVTGAFTLDPESRVPGDQLVNNLKAVCAEDAVTVCEATELSRRLVGDTIGANSLLLGVACQRGWLPVTAASIEQAIELNGVGVEVNLRVFRLGRALAHAPDKVASLLEVSGGEQAALIKGEFASASEQSLAEVTERMAAELKSYQNGRLAKRYRKLVERVEQAEKQSAPGMQGLALAAARYYYKLLAIKDEYEVARLYTDGSFARQLEENFSGDYELRFHMAPPILAKRDPASGELQKREFGPWMMPALKLLARLRPVRGTPLEIFGRTAERRQERQLIRDYQQLVDEVLAGLNHDNHPLAVELLSLPEQIRGYGHVKEANLGEVKQRWQQLLQSWRFPEEKSAAA